MICRWSDTVVPRTGACAASNDSVLRAGGAAALGSIACWSRLLTGNLSTVEGAK